MASEFSLRQRGCFVGMAALLVAGCGGSSATGGDGGSSATANGGGSTGGAGQGGHVHQGGSSSTGNPTSGGGGAGGSGGAIGIASMYPGDVGIDKDPAVVWSENFEEGSVGAITSRYDSFQNAPGMQLVTDVAPHSGGKAAIKWTSSAAANATDLYKKLPNHDELWVRWYAKYQAGVSWHHTGVWFGGYDPPLSYPYPHAGLKPNGDDRFAIAIEPAFDIGMSKPRLDFYNYWMTMHSWMDSPMGDTAYYGNSIVHQNDFTADNDEWMCLEVHAKMNTDVGSGTGAVLEVWKNDALVQHFDDMAVKGYWIKDKFCPIGADGSECTDYPPPSGTEMIPLDLQWRKTADLTLNYFWPQNYITDGPGGALELDDMVVATKRIGCIHP